MTKLTPGSLLYSFFEDYLKVQKGLRPASIQSYRDGLRLFLQFIGTDTHRRISKLSISDFTSDRVLRFLRHLEDDRGNGRQTRNHRLAALRLFFDYIAGRVPELLAEAERVQNIPRKRTPPPPTYFLERSDVQELFAALPSKELTHKRNLSAKSYGGRTEIGGVAKAHRPTVPTSWLFLLRKMGNSAGPHFIGDIPSAQSYSENCVWVFLSGKSLSGEARYGRRSLSCQDMPEKQCCLFC